MHPRVARRLTQATLVTLALVSLCGAASNAEARFDYATQWGTGGLGGGQFVSPVGIASDSAGNVYVADSDVAAGRVQRFTPEGAPLFGWGALGQFSSPRQVATDAFGGVYVSDSGNARVQKLGADGVPQLPGAIGSRGVGEGQFQLPAGLATDAEGNLYVADEQLGRVQKFTSDGAHLVTWDGAATPSGRFVAPRDVAVDAFGEVHVLDAGAGVISRFTAEGLFLGSYGSLGPLVGQLNAPGGIAADGAGRIFIADTGSNRVQVFSGEGVPLEQFGSVGAGNGQFNGPADVAADRAGVVYVSDTGNARVQKFVEPVPPVPPPEAFVTANVERVAGTVLIRSPGERAFVPLTRPRQVRLGSTIQARRGRVRLITAREKPRKGRPAVLQSAVFYDGSFTVQQPRAATPVVDLELTGGDFGACSAKQRKALRARGAEKKRRPGKSVRRLWGDGRGRYRTTGNFSASSVKGTIWLTEDRCDGTLTRVRKGTVEVLDLPRGRKILVRAGESYLARSG